MCTLKMEAFSGTLMVLYCVQIAEKHVVWFNRSIITNFFFQWGEN